MKYNEIRELLDKGFTAEYIMNMEESEDSDNSVASGSDPDAALQSAEDPATGDSISEQVSNAMAPVVDSLKNVIKEMQAANIMASRQEHNDETMTAEDALASIILPPTKGGTK